LIRNVNLSILKNLESINDEFTSINSRDKSLWEEFAETLYKIEDRITKGDSGLRSTTFPTFNKITGGQSNRDCIC